MDRLSPLPGDEHCRVFAHFMSALLYGRPLQLVNGGHSRRSFTYIDDAVSAIETLLNHPQAAKNQIVNIGNPHNETTIRELAHLMADLYRRKYDPAAEVRIESVAAEAFYGDGYEDCDRRLPDISKLQALHWQPQYGLEETFARSMEYCVAHREQLQTGPQP